MTDEFSIPAPGMTAFEIDHYADPRDDAEALAILLEERVAEPGARRCNHCDQPSPCQCDRDDAFHASRRFLTRHDQGRTR